MRLTLKKIERMTPRLFSELSIEEQYEFLHIARADYEVVQNLIQDRNEFRQLYYELRKQLIDNGLTPVNDYFNKSNKGRKKNYV